jgi:hypothetical protein
MRLTAREMWVLWIVIGLLLLGMLVKVYRAKHPGNTVNAPAGH